MISSDREDPFLREVTKNHVFQNVSSKYIKTKSKGTVTNQNMKTANSKAPPHAGRQVTDVKLILRKRQKPNSVVSENGLRIALRHLS